MIHNLCDFYSMLVKFTTKSYPDIVMFGNVASKLLKMMGHSGTVPSAIMHDDLPQYLSRLLDSLSNFEESENLDSKDVKENQEPVISLKNRAQPLIELMQSAIDNTDVVTWEQG